MMLQPRQGLTLCGFTTFRDDPPPALEQSDEPGDDLERTRRGRGLDRLFQTGPQKTGACCVPRPKAALDHPAEVDAENRLRQRPSPSPLPTRAWVHSVRTTE